LRSRCSQNLTTKSLELVPDNITSFLKGLKESDIAILKEVAANYENQHETEDQAIAEIKKKSPELGEKVESLHKMILDKVNALNPEAKEFALEMYRIVRKLHTKSIAGQKITAKEITDQAQQVIEKFKALPTAAQEDLKKQFPITVHAFTSKKINKMVARLLVNG
ncbi:nematode fatty acid retinoid binding protein, partial [Cooperia oncophora]